MNCTVYEKCRRSASRKHRRKFVKAIRRIERKLGRPIRIHWKD